MSPAIEIEPTAATAGVDRVPKRRTGRDIGQVLASVRARIALPTDELLIERGNSTRHEDKAAVVTR